MSKKINGVDYGFTSKNTKLDKNVNWKGKEASYYAKHIWVSYNHGKPTKCEHCGKDGLTGRKIHWANISGEYKRDINDWKRLCVPCHSKYDRERYPERFKPNSGQFPKGHTPWIKGRKKINGKLKKI